LRRTIPSYRVQLATAMLWIALLAMPYWFPAAARK
jgi:hypothetical protein